MEEEKQLSAGDADATNTECRRSEKSLARHRHRNTGLTRSCQRWRSHRETEGPHSFKVSPLIFNQLQRENVLFIRRKLLAPI